MKLKIYGKLINCAKSIVKDVINKITVPYLDTESIYTRKEK